MECGFDVVVDKFNMGQNKCSYIITGVATLLRYRGGQSQCHPPSLTEILYFKTNIKHVLLFRIYRLLM